MVKFMLAKPRLVDFVHRKMDRQYLFGVDQALFKIIFGSCLQFGKAFGGKELVVMSKFENPVGRSFSKSLRRLIFTKVFHGEIKIGIRAGKDASQILDYDKIKCELDLIWDAFKKLLAQKNRKHHLTMLNLTGKMVVILTKQMAMLNKKI